MPATINMKKQKKRKSSDPAFWPGSTPEPAVAACTPPPLLGPCSPPWSRSRRILAGGRRAPVGKRERRGPRVAPPWIRGPRATLPWIHVGEEAGRGGGQGAGQIHRGSPPPYQIGATVEPWSRIHRILAGGRRARVGKWERRGPRVRAALDPRGGGDREGRKPGRGPDPPPASFIPPDPPREPSTPLDRRRLGAVEPNPPHPRQWEKGAGGEG